MRRDVYYIKTNCGDVFVVNEYINVKGALFQVGPSRELITGKVVEFQDTYLKIDDKYLKYGEVYFDRKLDVCVKPYSIEKVRYKKFSEFDTYKEDEVYLQMLNNTIAKGVDERVAKEEYLRSFEEVKKNYKRTPFGIEILGESKEDRVKKELLNKNTHSEISRGK